MNANQPKMCRQCGTFYLPHQEQDHLNLHIDPTRLAPKTTPNNLKRIQLSKVILADEGTDSTDIALRSLLPDQIPHPETQKQNVRPPQIQDQPRNDSLLPAHNAHKNSDQYRLMGDRLDLHSKLANSDLSKDQFNKLQIEKQVQLKPIKTMVAKKQIHKFQNSHYAGKQTKDLGGCEKKVKSGDVGNGGYGGYGQGSGSGAIVGSSQPQPGYEVKADNSYLTNPSRKATVIVPINRKTGNPNEFRAVETKANQENGRQSKKVSANHDNEGSFDDEEGHKKVVATDPNQNLYAKKNPTETDPNMFAKKHDHRGVQVGQFNSHSHGTPGLHSHQCPDCHGFYCPTCHATIPPEYRPFWDNDQSPEMVEYYKKRVKAARQQERKLRNQCETCHNPKLP